MILLSAGAGIGGGFKHTSELIPMKYHEAMKKDPKGWKKAVQKEHERMVEHGVFKPIDMNQNPKNSKILTSTWSIKQKADGTKRARLNARGFEQIPGEHYSETGVSSPVVNEASISNKRWDGVDRNYLFEITGESDLTFTIDPVTKRSVSGWNAKLNGVSYTRKTKMQKFVKLSVTEAECVAATSCVREMIYAKHFIESLGLRIKYPMTLFMDNQGGVDIFNNCSIAGNTRAVFVRFCYIRELKEKGWLDIKWKSGGSSSADLFTKNLDGITFTKHTRMYMGVGFLSGDDFTAQEEECRE